MRPVRAAEHSGLNTDRAGKQPDACSTDTRSRLIDRDEAARKVARVFHERQDLDLGNDGDLSRVFEECAGFPIDPRWLGQLRTAVVNRLGEVEL